MLIRPDIREEFLKRFADERDHDEPSEWFRKWTQDIQKSFDEDEGLKDFISDTEREANIDDSNSEDFISGMITMYQLIKYSLEEDIGDVSRDGDQSYC